MEIKDEWFRPAAYYLVSVMRMKQIAVAELFGVTRQMVSRVIKRFDETGSYKNRAEQGRKRTARNEETIQEAADLLQKTITQSSEMAYPAIRQGNMLENWESLESQLGVFFARI